MFTVNLRKTLSGMGLAGIILLACGKEDQGSEIVLIKGLAR